jgi:hypothetical protein
VRRLFIGDAENTRQRVEVVAVPAGGFEESLVGHQHGGGGIGVERRRGEFARFVGDERRMGLDKFPGRFPRFIAQGLAQKAETARLGGLGKGRLGPASVPDTQQPLGRDFRRLAGKPQFQKGSGQFLQDRKIIIGGEDEGVDMLCRRGRTHAHMGAVEEVEQRLRGAGQLLRVAGDDR